MRTYEPFTPISSSVPSFNATTTGIFVMESTLRKWQGPGGRSVRLAINSTGVPVTALFASSANAVVVIGSAVRVLQGTAEVFGVQPSWTSVAFESSESTNIDVNVTLGTGQ